MYVKISFSLEAFHSLVSAENRKTNRVVVKPTRRSFRLFQIKKGEMADDGPPPPNDGVVHPKY